MENYLFKLEIIYNTQGFKKCIYSQETKENPSLRDPNLSRNANSIIYCRSMEILQKLQQISNTVHLAEVFRSSNCESTPFIFIETQDFYTKSYCFIKPEVMISPSLCIYRQACKILQLSILLVSVLVLASALVLTLKKNLIDNQILNQYHWTDL